MRGKPKFAAITMFLSIVLVKGSIYATNSANSKDKAHKSHRKIVVMTHLKVACVQMNSGDDIQANIASAEAMIRQAHADGAMFITLPENAFLMVDHKTTKLAIFPMDEHPGVIAMQALAKKLKCSILIGSVAVLQKDASQKPVNRSVLINANGTIAAQYDKIHLFDVTLPNGEVHAESNRFDAGNKAVIAQLPECKIGMTICYDLRFPHLYRSLAKEGTSIMCVPAAFTKLTGKIHWHVLLRARAIENGCFIIAPAQGGTHPGGRETFGHSVIIDPWGRVLAEQQNGVGIITAELDLSEVEKTRRAIPALKHDREFQ
jgi:predicted amidohydrolase